MTPALPPLAQATMGIAMLGAFACLFGGGYLIVRRRDVKKGALMLVLAAVLLGNVLIWTL